MGEVVKDNHDHGEGVGSARGAGPDDTSSTRDYPSVAEEPLGSMAEPPEPPGVREPMLTQKRRQMMLFSASLISPMAASGIVFFGKDVYVLKFAADIGFMGLTGTVLAVAGPLFNPIVGYCMETVPLNSYFAWATWGRRAPWFLTHTLVMAVATAAIFMPPSFGPVFLCWWFFLWALIASWCLAVAFIAFESTRVEAYPTKEERSEVEAVCKLSAGIGTGIGLGVPLMVAAGSPFHVLVLASMVSLLGGLVSLVAVPTLRKARMEFQPEFVGSFWNEIGGLLRVPVVRHLVTYRFIEDWATTMAITASMYYLTFVEGLFGAERSVYIGLSSVAIGLITVLMLPCWTQFFRIRRRGININKLCSVVVVLGLLAPAMLAIGDLLPPGVGFICYCFLFQGSLTGQTYWRAVVLGWVVDEDCHAAEGRRREAMLVGLVSFFASAGRAVAVGIVMVGLAICGMDVVNCERDCAGQAPAADGTDCVKACDEQNFLRQPEEVKLFLRILYLAVISVCQAIAAVLVFTFPICNARLDAIYDKQAKMFAAIDAAAASNTRPEEAGVEEAKAKGGHEKAARAWIGTAAR